MKKQIGLIALTALLLTFVAFSGVASAQASDVQVVMFTSPLCETCQKVHPYVVSAAAKYGVKLIEYDVSDTTSKGIAEANGVTATPTIVISGAQSARFVGDVTQAQLEAAIKAAIGNPTPTPTPKVTPKVVTPTPTPKVVQKATTPTPKPTTIVKVQQTETKTTKATPTPTAYPTTTAQQQPNIEVVQPQTQTQTTATQTVPEFSLLGLGAPALIIGAIYLFMRRE